MMLSKCEIMVWYRTHTRIFYDAVEMGLDIEFFIDGIRYNISWQNNKPFICVCPDGEPNYYSDTQDLLDNHKIDGVPIKDLWQNIDIYAM